MNDGGLNKYVLYLLDHEDPAAALEMIGILLVRLHRHGELVCLHCAVKHYGSPDDLIRPRLRRYANTVPS